MNRFFIDENQVSEDGCIMIDDPDDISHISKVLRLKTGDKVELSDNKAYEYLGEIVGIEKKEIELRILSKKAFDTEPPVRITLFQGLPKKDKMEYIIQKCTEVGIGEIIPLDTKRTVVKTNEKFGKKLERWRKIALEAAKQSKRGKVPDIGDVMKYDDLLESGMDAFDLVVLCYEDEKKTRLKDIMDQAKGCESIALIIGPEGGFESSEVAQLKAQGAKIVTLGNRILRTETAGVVATALMIYECEGW